MGKKEIILSLNNIVKKYPGVIALDNVSLELRRGEIHALVGENGAGKSTLIKVCSGAISPDSGAIMLDGMEYKRMDPQLSKTKGIGVIYQELSLVDTLSVAENVFLGVKLKNGLFIDRAAMNREAKKIFEQMRVSLDPEANVSDITVGYQQVVAIAKAIALNAKILIMDEPSAPLTENEVEAMFNIVDNLKANGVSIIYISHRLPEIFRVADRVTILRDGKKIDTLVTSETSTEQLVNLMVGRDLHESYPEHDSGKIGDKLLEVKNISGNGLKDISISVRQGEIFGLAGLIGSGRTELAELIFGVKKTTSGDMLFKGKKYKPKSTEDAIKAGIALMTEDRKRLGLVLGNSIRENMTLAVLKRISKGMFISRSKEKNIASKFIKSIQIKTPSMEQPVQNLSGGNQQKVVLAKWLAANPDLIIFDEPTRGIDVGAKQEIYNLMKEQIFNGKTIIMISSEMEEILRMADRIAVLYEGRITGELEKKDFTQENVMALASNMVK